MSGAKEELYRPMRETARGAGRFGDSIGWDWLENESKRNKDNPGRALGKSVGYAAAYMSGAALGNALAGGAGGAGAAGGAAAGAAEGMSAPISAGLLADIPMEAAAAGMSGGSGLLSSAPAIQAGMSEAAANGALAMESGMAGGYTPSSLKFAFQNASAANGTPLGQNLANYGKQAAQNAMNWGGSKEGKQFAGRMGLEMMKPPPQQPMQQSRPFQQAPQEPLPMPYQNQGPPPGMSMQEWLKRKQMGLI